MLFETVSLSRYIIASIVVFGLIALLAGALTLLKRHRYSGAFNKPNKKRLNVKESLMLSGKHKLVIVQQDDIEHTILIGGMTDVHLGTAPAQNVAAIAEETAPAPTKAESIGFLKPLPKTTKPAKPKPKKNSKKSS